MSVDHLVDTRYYRANIKGVFKTQSSIYDGAYLRKYLTAKRP